MSEQISTFHELLVWGDDFSHCQEQVLRFFKNTLLVRYDHLQVVAEKSLPATNAAFKERVEKGIATNRREVAKLLHELQATGVTSLEEMSAIPTGYQSKVLHILAHLLDGFIGIDSRFYNLTADSHWVTAGEWQKIDAEPARYWLLYLEASSASVAAASLVHL